MSSQFEYLVAHCPYVASTGIYSRPTSGPLPRHDRSYDVDQVLPFLVITAYNAGLDCRPGESTEARMVLPIVGCSGDIADLN
jgi:hypothetical protein